MLTIKHITPMGNEAVHETEAVSYTPAAHVTGTRIGFGGSTGTLWYQSTVTGQSVPISDGSVYVMNDSGSTVAKYDLGGWAEPACDTAGSLAA